MAELGKKQALDELGQAIHEAVGAGATVVELRKVVEGESQAAYENEDQKRIDAEEEAKDEG